MLNPRLIILVLILSALAYGLRASAEATEIAAGVAIFLLGMLALEAGFKAFTGGALERVLKKSTDKLWKSLAFGVVSTTITQSSSLVSVITISFLSAGLLGLAQGVGIIFGANLGTTTGAWLIAGLGLKVNIAAYAMPMLVFGVVLSFTSSKSLKGLGSLLVGLGFLFLGIHYMKEGFETLAQSIDLSEYAVPGLTGLLLFTAIGIFATVVMQSSHATLVLIITALAAGQITYENALALAIGANVGTTITAILGAISANIAGKRLAGAHLIFNVVTGIIALVFIHQFVLAVEVGAGWLGIAADNHTLKLALFHTLFNLTGIVACLPFKNQLVVFLETRFKPAARKVTSPKFINETMMQMPDAGLEAARKEIGHLFTNVFDVMSMVLHTDPSRLRKGDQLEMLANAPEQVREIDVDDYYQRRVKPLHGDILDFLARLPTEDNQSRQAFVLRASTQDLIEALKDLKHLQKNMVRYLVSPNPYLRKEYVAIRKHLALLLHQLHRLANGEVDNPTLAFDVLAADMESQDIVGNGTLDELIREKRISSEVATSLMNDNGYAYDISRNLLSMGRAAFLPHEPIDHQLESALHLDEPELEAILTSGSQANKP